ncbi:low temperature requirement protein A [Micromonospora sp. NBC_00389]|uniref:low temperature requirement protein A n=1 Tax=Micromonospora sp. NBC_00389 TaxID=2903586 RepID=UPI003FA551BD
MTSRLPPDSLLIQVMAFITMTGAVVMAIAAAQGFGRRSLLFAGAYVALQITRPLLLLVFRPQWASIPYLLSVAVSGVPWIVGGLVNDDGLHTRLWTLALAIGYSWSTVSWLRDNVAMIAGEHLAERLQQFLSITLGATIFVSASALSDSELDFPHAAGFGLAFVASPTLTLTCS